MNKENLYVMLMKNRKELNPDIIIRHGEHLRLLDEHGQLFLCGPFTDYPGGIVILVTHSLEDAHKIASSDPFISEGYKTYELRSLIRADKSNNYLID